MNIKTFIFTTIVALFTVHLSIAKHATVSGNDVSDKNVGYGCVIDAGSSGSRIYVYQWPKRNFKSLPIPITEVYKSPVINKKIKPGISAFVDNPTGAGPSLNPLLTAAKAAIPAAVDLKTVPIYLGATAGMRVLAPEKSNLIFDSIRSTLKSSGFHFKDKWARIISGEEEGTYGWIAANYLKNTLNTGDSEKTYGALDLGGASTQISFTPIESILANMFPVHISSKVDYQIYTHSFLYYGVNEAISRFNEKLIADGKTNKNVPNPCYPKGYNDNGFNGTSDWNACLSKTLDLFDFNAPCYYSDQNAQRRCSFNGIYQPSIQDGKKFIGMSAFYYTWSFLKLATGVNSDNLDTLLNEAKSVCKKTFAEQKETNPSYNQQNQCFNVAYVYHLLYSGYHMDATDTPIEIYSDILGSEVTWSLGAMMVEANNLSFTYEQNPLYEVLFYITLCVCVACLIGGLVSFRWLTKKRQPGERNVRGNNLKTSLISENDAKSDGNNV